MQGTSEEIVKEYYRGATVLLTGFTGSIGKVLLEKLLWSCEDVEKIFVLVRKKKGVNTDERVNQVLSSSAFNRLRSAYPGRLAKVVGVEGDIEKEGLGLSEADQERLARETTVVIHSAATVRFNEYLQTATNVNVLGTYRLVQLAKAMPSLKCFIHVSTAYSNCYRKYTNEQLYPPIVDWRKLIKTSENVDSIILSKLSAKYCGDIPNTYVLTKNAAEHIVDEAKEYFPVVICRPSIVSISLEEPVPGWANSLIGPLGASVVFSLGIGRVAVLHADQKVDTIYLDFVVKGIIASVFLATQGLQNTDTPVINICASKSHFLKWDELHSRFHEGSRDYMMKLNADCSNILMCSSKIMYSFYLFQKHLISAYFVDFLLRIFGRQPMLVKLRRKVYLTAKDVDWFGEKTFYFNTENFHKLAKILSKDESFKMDLCIPVDLVTLLKNYMINGFSELVGEVMNNISENRKYLLMLYYVDLGAVYLTNTIFAYLIYRSEVLQRIISYLVHFFTDEI